MEIAGSSQQNSFMYSLERSYNLRGTFFIFSHSNIPFIRQPENHTRRFAVFNLFGGGNIATLHNYSLHICTRRKASGGFLGKAQGAFGVAFGLAIAGWIKDSILPKKYHKN
ncbi:MAG: hypothetical protein P8Y45_20390, partial [Exilibacterium sp.]